MFKSSWRRVWLSAVVANGLCSKALSSKKLANFVVCFVTSAAMPGTLYVTLVEIPSFLVIGMFDLSVFRSLYKCLGRKEDEVCEGDFVSSC